MSNIHAIRSGNWDAPAIWNTNSVPSLSNNVYANNFVVTLSTNQGAVFVSTRSAAGINAGGRFQLLNNVTLSANMLMGPLPDGTGSIRFSLASPNSARIVGHVYWNENLTGGENTGIVNSFTGTLYISGNIIRDYQGGSNSSTRSQLINNGGGRVFLTGDIDGQINISGSGNGSQPIVVNGSTMFINGTVKQKVQRWGMTLQNTGTLFLTGEVLGSSGFSNSEASIVNSGVIQVSGNVYAPGAPYKGGFLPGGSSEAAIRNIDSGRVVILGDVYGGTGGTDPNCTGICHAGTNTVTVCGRAIGGIGPAIIPISTGTTFINTVVGGPGGPTAGSLISFRGPGVQASQNTLVFVEKIEFGAQGATPITGPVFLTPTDDNLFTMRRPFPDFTPVTFFNSFDIEGIFPAEGDVRKGIVYGLGDFTGTMAVPSPSAVQFDVPVDDTVGALFLRPENFWEIQRSEITNPTTIGYRLKNVATIGAAGQLLGSFNVEGLSGYNLP